MNICEVRIIFCIFTYCAISPLQLEVKDLWQSYATVYKFSLQIQEQLRGSKHRRVNRGTHVETEEQVFIMFLFTSKTCQV